MAEPFVELRGDILREHIDVIDAVVHATPGASRMSVLREIVTAWVEHKCHEAMLVERVRHANGIAPESQRSRAGSGREA